MKYVNLIIKICFEEENKLWLALAIELFHPHGRAFPFIEKGISSEAKVKESNGMHFFPTL